MKINYLILLSKYAAFRTAAQIRFRDMKLEVPARVSGCRKTWHLKSVRFQSSS